MSTAVSLPLTALNGDCSRQDYRRLASSDGLLSRSNRSWPWYVNSIWRRLLSHTHRSTSEWLRRHWYLSLLRPTLTLTRICALEVFYENALYKFTFDIDIWHLCWGPCCSPRMWHLQVDWAVTPKLTSTSTQTMWTFTPAFQFSRSHTADLVHGEPAVSSIGGPYFVRHLTRLADPRRCCWVWHKNVRPSEGSWCHTRLVDDAWHSSDSDSQGL